VAYYPIPKEPDKHIGYKVLTALKFRDSFSPGFFNITDTGSKNIQDIEAVPKLQFLEQLP
jgi:hypothetical protein